MACTHGTEPLAVQSMQDQGLTSISFEDVVSYIEPSYRSQSGYTAQISGASRPLLALLRAPVSLGTTMESHVDFNDPDLVDGGEAAMFDIGRTRERGVVWTNVELRPCVDCGLMTRSFCTTFMCPWLCFAENWIPSEHWAPWQQTPFCTHCERKFEGCHFCRGEAWCTPFTHCHRNRPASPHEMPEWYRRELEEEASAPPRDESRTFRWPAWWPR